MTNRGTPDPALVARLHAALRGDLSVRLAVLFGSAAAGASRADSDLDVAIQPAPVGLNAAGEAALRARLTRATGGDVDLVRLDESVSTLLRWQIATTGVALFEAQPGAFARFRAEAAAEYIDFAPALAHHGEIFRRRLVATGRAPMTNAALVLAKLTTLRDHLGRIERRRPAGVQSLRGDLDRQDALALSVLVALQEAADIALHIASDEGWGVASSYADSFSLLARHQVIDTGLADRLAAIAALRNRIAHGYGTVDVDRLWTESPAGVAALQEYAAAIARYLDKPRRAPE